MTDSTLAADRKWPYRPDFNQFTRQAKELLKAYRLGDVDAVAEVLMNEPAPDPAAFALHQSTRSVCSPEATARRSSSFCSTRCRHQRQGQLRPHSHRPDASERPP